jgi:phage baseplate assembly protein W
MNPTYGTIIWDAIFEPLTEDLRNSISEDIKQIIQNDPRVIAEDIKVDEFQSGILLEITLRYQTNNLSSVLKLTFDKELGLITE